MGRERPSGLTARGPEPDVSRVYSFVWGESMVQTRERFNKVAVDKEAAS